MTGSNSAQSNLKLSYVLEKPEAKYLPVEIHFILKDSPNQAS